MLEEFVGVAMTAVPSSTVRLVRSRSRPRIRLAMARWSTDAMTSETHGRFKRWFWRPPRAHGEIIADRQVSVLELFYDLV
jgi:hypothetical protein